MKLYNTLTRRIEELKPQNPAAVKMYICGPTVYNAPTIGNLRTYISEDLLRRALKYQGYKVHEVMNITDIEDKIIRDVTRAGLDPENKSEIKKFTQKYEDIFLDNLKSLNIEPVEAMPHATDEEVVAKMIEIISDLLKKDIAYKSEDGSVYFSIGKYAGYGQLSRLKKREVKDGARVSQDEYDKENAQDFALWKAVKPGEPSWEAPFGKGRPGWHIECTAMSTMHLGNTVDIHGGGVDLVFPHHENEIAQSEAYTGQKFVISWFHTGHLHINGQRMGKSLGNYYLLSDLARFKASPLSYRLLCLQSHYRDTMNFTEESIVAAQTSYNNLKKDVATLLLASTRQDGGKAASDIFTAIEEARIKFDLALEDDLSTPRALAELFKLLGILNSTTGRDYTKEDAIAVLEFLYQIDTVLGLEFKKISLKLPTDTAKLAQERMAARESKDWHKSDSLRSQIEALGYVVEDTSMGQLIFK